MLFYAYWFGLSLMIYGPGSQRNTRSTPLDRLISCLTLKEPENVLMRASGSSDEAWKKIWKLKVPPKIKVFWWCIIHEFLLACQILYHRHLEPIANYEVCGANKNQFGTS